MAKRERIQKTNAMRELDRAKVRYDVHVHDLEGDFSRGIGERIAEQEGTDPDATFKTLVCVAPSGDHVVCCVPVRSEVDLKKAASAAGEKSLELMPIARLEQVTGYVRGGCSPVGMRKAYPTLIDETALLFDEISISGGRRDVGITLSPEDLARVVGASFADIVRI